VFHASTIPLEAGSILATSEAPSPYWRNLFNAGVMTDQDYHNVKQFPSPQNQAFALERYHLRGQAFKELAFELFRKDNFPHLPSRRNCIFVMEDAKLWMPLLITPGEPRILHEVRILPSARTVRLDAHLLGGNNLHYDHFQERAHRYWTGQGGTLWETLVDGAIEIVRQVEYPSPIGAENDSHV
jgi:hypothetical protein